MSLLDSVGGKMPRTMGFALIVAFLSLGAISGCDLGIDDDYDFLEPDRPDGSDGSDGSDGGFGGEETPEGCSNPDNNPCTQYVMVTFDDGIPVIPALTKILPLIKNCDIYPKGSKPSVSKIYPLIPTEGDVKDLKKCINGEDRRKNPDGSDVRITYYATVGYGAALDNMDYLGSLGNEIANHTTTHGTWNGGTGQPVFQDETVYTVEKWAQELSDMADILNYWTSIPRSSIVGVRAPYLEFNNNTFKGIYKYLATHDQPGDEAVYYDSSIHYDPTIDNVLHPPKPLTVANYCDPEQPAKIRNPKEVQPPKAGSNFITLDPTTQVCNKMIPEGEQGGLALIWEMPMPVLGKFLMELPEDLKDLNTFLEYQKNSNPDGGSNNPGYVPMMIAMHASELGAHPDFLNWMLDAQKNYGVNFVTVSNIVDLYALGREEVTPTTPYELKAACLDNIGGGDAVKCEHNSVNSTAYLVTNTPCNTVGQCSDTKCSLLCDDNYGAAENCKIKKSDADGFTTCNRISDDNSCDPIPPAEVAVYNSGAFPWLGNPSGNKSSGSLCNEWPTGAPPFPDS
jgi:hypothetical protein